MPTSYIPINTGKPLGASLYQGIRMIQEGINMLLLCQRIAGMQIDGADHTLFEQEFGLQPGQGDDAKGELDSMLSKFTTDAAVTAVLAARNQAAAKFGVV